MINDSVNCHVFREIIPCLWVGDRKSSATNSRQSAGRHIECTSHLPVFQLHRVWTSVGRPCMGPTGSVESNAGVLRGGGVRQVSNQPRDRL